MARKERLISIDRKIDQFALEEANEEQADIYGFWARECANAKEDRDVAKAEWEKLAGEIQIKIRTSNYNMPIDKNTGKPLKITEGSVAALLLIDKSVDDAKNKYIKMEGIYSRSRADENSIEHRRSSLNNLGVLWEKEYYNSLHTGSTSRPTKENQKSEAQMKGLNTDRKKKSS